MSSDTVGTGKDHASLTAWEAATDNDLVTATEGEIALLADEVHDLTTAKLSIAGATVDATYYREIKWDVSRYNHLDGTGPRVHSAEAEEVVSVGEAFVRITGIYVRYEGAGSTTNYIIHLESTGDDSTVDGCVCEWAGTSTGTRRGLYGASTADNAFARNCIVIGAHLEWAGNTLRMHNCINYGSPEPDTVFDTSTQDGCDNIASFGNTGTDDFRNTSAAAVFITNASEDATATGTGCIASIVPADEFVDAANGDFRLWRDSQLKSAGTDNSGLYTTDIEGNTWGTETGSWHIGVYDTTVARDGSGIIAEISRRRSNARIRRM